MVQYAMQYIFIFPYFQWVPFSGRAFFEWNNMHFIKKKNLIWYHISNLWQPTSTKVIICYTHHKYLFIKQLALLRYTSLFDLFKPNVNMWAQKRVQSPKEVLQFYWMDKENFFSFFCASEANLSTCSHH